MTKPQARLSAEIKCRIVEGGGLLFTDDLWTCETCGQQKYPESFACQYGNRVVGIS